MTVEKMNPTHGEIRGGWEEDELEFILDQFGEDGELPSQENLRRIYVWLKNFYFDKFEETEVPSIDRVYISWSNRLKKVAGKWSDGVYYDTVPEGYDFWIRLSKPYHEKYPLDTPMTLAHEMIHFHAGGHGKYFEEILQILRDEGCQVYPQCRERAESWSEKRERKKKQKEKQEEKEKKADWMIKCDCNWFKSCTKSYLIRKSKNVKKLLKGKHVFCQYRNCPGELKLFYKENGNWIEY